MGSSKPARVALYDLVIAEVFSRVRAGVSGGHTLNFDRALIDKVIGDLRKSGKLPKNIQNVPDIKYTYDARRDFPSSITSTGNWAIVGRGKSKYSFVKIARPNLIHLPTDIASILVTKSLKDKTPRAVKKCLGTDEQATMTKVRYSGIIEDFTGLTFSHHLQGHERTTISVGQVEIDEVYVGGDSNGQDVVIPISAKGGSDMLSYTQALNLNLYAAEKARFAGFQIRPLGIVRIDDASMYVVEFSTGLGISAMTVVKAALYQLL